MKHKADAFIRLLTIMDELRERCPWDRKQTMSSLSTLTIEETYELVDEITKQNLDGVKEELGDLMLHMVFYAKIADEQSAFDISDVLNAVCEKLIRRHPHIYGDTVVQDADQVKQNWELIKMAEKGKKSIFQGVPISLPAIIKAQRMQEKAAQVGFEWEKKEEVWSKVEEELSELKECIPTNDYDKINEEFGDVLFSLINYSRFIGVDANRALDKANRKFKSRVEFIEKNGTSKMGEMTLDEMDNLWNQAKKLESK